MKYSDSPINHPQELSTPDEAAAYASLSKLVNADRPIAVTLARVSVLAARA